MTRFNSTTGSSPATYPEQGFDFDAWVRQVRPQLLACVQQSPSSPHPSIRLLQPKARRQIKEVPTAVDEG
jgi:hypothetical protein